MRAAINYDNDETTLCKSILNLYNVFNGNAVRANAYFVNEVLCSDEFKRSSVYGRYRKFNSLRRRVVKMMRLVGYADYETNKDDDELFIVALVANVADAYRNKNDVNGDVVEYAFERMCTHVVFTDGRDDCKNWNPCRSQLASWLTTDDYDELLKTIFNVNNVCRVYDAFYAVPVELDGDEINFNDRVDLLKIFSHVTNWRWLESKNAWFDSLILRNEYFKRSDVGKAYYASKNYDKNSFVAFAKCVLDYVNETGIECKELETLLRTYVK